MAQAAGGNPLFQGLPNVDWRLSHEPELMVTRHGDIRTFILEQLDAQEVGTFQVTHGGQNFTFRLLPQGGFFTVTVWPSEGWVQQLPLRLLFSFHNLYLLGFSHEDVWYVYDDADLTGSGYNEQLHGRYLKKLNFDGGYNGNVLEQVPVSITDLDFSYNVLIRYLQHKQAHKQAQVAAALYKFIVVLPEAWRFPEWNTYLLEAFSDYRQITVDVVDGDLKFSNLFQKWDKISKRVLKGPNAFHTFTPLNGFPAYANLLPTVSVLLPQPQDA